MSLAAATRQHSIPKAIEKALMGNRAAYVIWLAYGNKALRGPKVEDALRDGGSCQTGFAQLVLGQHLKGRACLNNMDNALFSRAIDFTIRRDQRC